ncbi:MFS transporter [Rhodovulum sp. PH10]|uniref:MFS transporter n=1 Tax=Rhodovulum sp. PH10 TaxID=1187851 RepID=UPI00058C07A1|nr:MFS transporter [Rhodovulum sp. PH10]
MTTDQKRPEEADWLNLRIIGHAIDSSPITRPILYVIILAALAALFDATESFLMGFALPGVAKEFELRPEMMGSFGAAYMYGNFMGSIGWGWIADKCGRKVAFTVTILCFSILSGLCGLATGVIFLVSLRFAIGVFLGGAVPVDAAILSEFSPARIRGYANGMLPITWPLATMLTSVIAMLILPNYGWRGLFVVGCLPAFLLFWVLRWVPESPRWLVNQGRFKEARRALRQIEIDDAALERSREATKNERPAPKLPSGRFRDLFAGGQTVKTVHVWLLWLLAQMAAVGMSFWMPQLFVRIAGLSIHEAVGYMFYIAFFTGAGRLTVVLLSEKVGRKPFIVLGFCGAALPLLSLIWASEPTELFWSFAFFGFFGDMGMCAATIYVPEVFPMRIRTLGISTAMGIGRIGGGTGSALIGIFLGAGMATELWVYLAGACLIAGILTIFLGIESKGKSLEELNEQAAPAGK